jgi:hypothetical protein
MTMQTERRSAMKTPRALHGTAALFVLALAAPAVAQPALNIAGIYRGQMTDCLSAARLADCRKGYFELIRLAEDVDARRIEWEGSVPAGGAQSAKLREGYALAKERLNRAVDDFNRDMSAPAVDAKQERR